MVTDTIAFPKTKSTYYTIASHPLGGTRARAFIVKLKRKNLSECTNIKSYFQFTYVFES